jgi:hypothetical protein
MPIAEFRGSPDLHSQIVLSYIITALDVRDIDFNPPHMRE